MSKYKVWECKIIVPEGYELPNGFDYPPRDAAIKTIEDAGISVLGCLSGWGGKLTDEERSAIDDDVPIYHEN